MASQTEIHAALLTWEQRWDYGLRERIIACLEAAERERALMRGIDVALNDAGYVKRTEEAQVP